MKKQRLNVINDSDSGLHISKYHDTIIFRANHNTGLITLNSDGWKTVTTKKYINQELRQYGYSLFQKKFQWYVKDENKTCIAYSDGMQLPINS